MHDLALTDIRGLTLQDLTVAIQAMITA